MKILESKYIFMLCFLCASCAHVSSSSNQTIIPQFHAVDNFALLDHQGKFHELYYYFDKKVIVLIAQGNGCPIIRQSVPYLNELRNRFESLDVEFFMINANAQDDRASIVEEVKEFGITIPVLEDKAQLVSESLGITRMAEVVVIDTHNWNILYQGPLSDHLGYETRKKKIQHHYVRDVLDAFLAGRAVTPVKNPAKGCLITYENQPHNPEYIRDITPILIKSCVPCHSPGGVAPWSMDDYKKVKGWGNMIREAVRTQRMPPWHADTLYNHFKNDIALSSQETRTLVRWVEEGFLRGDGEDPLLATPRPQFDQWSLGKPDVVLTFPEEQEIPPTGTLGYRIITADFAAKEDLWVRAMDLRPGNIKAVHHCDVAIQMPEDVLTSSSPVAQKWANQSGLKVDGVGQIIAGYAPGYTSLFELPEDTGMLIPKGAKITFLMHYITTGKTEKDLTKLGLYLYPRKPSRVYSVVQLSNKDFKIPAGEKEYALNASHVFEQDIVLTSLTPHMHYRGKRMVLSAYYPDGTKEILLSVPHFKFAWQRRYILRDPKKIPAGTRIVAEGAYDNSAENLDNPDPKKEVGFGSMSDDEMFSAFLSYTTQEDSLK